MTLRRSFGLVIRRILHLYRQVAHGVTLGVRGMVIDDAGRVFLVKHSYIAGWYLPGGGVEVEKRSRPHWRGSCGRRATSSLPIRRISSAVYLNRRVSRRDHVALYVVRSFHQSAEPLPNREIVAHGFFLPDLLPDDTTLSTRARITEVLEGRAAAEIW